ncbi:MAG TPA: LPXTG cell wall anchor domain-containing protein [Thermodesulfobacteriota bacterium]|nr:LPXTG cell wall anchor domain-containing protein [Thermodesulfobacteriota bacterium]
MHKETWPFLFILGGLFLNWPFLDLFKAYLPYYIFTVWGLFILVMGLLISFSRKKKKDQDV